MADRVDNGNLQFTRIEVAEFIKGILIGVPQFPVTVEVSFEGTGFSIPVFLGDFEIQIPIEIQKGVAPGTYSIPCILHYQPCDNQKYYFPREADLFIRVEVL